LAFAPYSNRFFIFQNRKAKLLLQFLSVKIISPLLGKVGRICGKIEEASSDNYPSLPSFHLS
jgi:hypothetical protein